MISRWAIALATTIALGSAQSQSLGDEMRVGSEMETYVRLLGLVRWDTPRSWAIRPIVPPQTPARWPPHPWRARFREDRRPLRLLRVQVRSSMNASFAWQSPAADSWQGKGLNLSAAAGAAATLWKFSARLEPVISYTVNQPFELENPTAGFRDPVSSGSIDEPQRFGSSALRSIGPGESFVRTDMFGFAIGLSNERLYWGPGVRHAILFSADGARFPHIFAGTSAPISFGLGQLRGQLLYGRLDESNWAPPSLGSRRFGAGMIASWIPPRFPLELGIARLYHKPWPDAFRAKDLMSPFGSLFTDAQTFAGGVADNQLATSFFSLRVSRLAMELFGEFARNDRSVNARDLSVEPEHNSAWLMGFLKAFAFDSSGASFWSVRYEAASARVSGIQAIPRPQSRFYEHAPLTQGHTQRGLLLGTLLIDRSGGSELAIDRWASNGRTGFAILQRQMPPDVLLGMPVANARTQWDVAGSAVRFIGDSELNLRLGHVWDLNRFANRDVGNVYVVVGWRQAVSP